MSLSDYRKKREFNKTPEPAGGVASGSALLFVVQKHDASHLHYDFRLEIGGVLKSWAVPKGPSMDPSVKRLAMMVEDHPYDYKNFEGVIPKGQYGGGTVIVWDQGTYEATQSTSVSKKDMEKSLLAQIHKGKLTVRLTGKKLKGEFTLVKSNYQGDNSWLLIKVQDDYATKSDITQKDKSVVSGKTIQQMEKNPDRIYRSAKKEGSRNSPLENSGLSDKSNGKRKAADPGLTKAAKKANVRSSISKADAVVTKPAGRRTTSKGDAVLKKTAAPGTTSKADAVVTKPVGRRTTSKRDLVVTKPGGNNLATYRVVAKKSKSLPKAKQDAGFPASKKVKSPFPSDLAPMLATLASKPFDNEGWLYEIKWDGYRALAFLNKGIIELSSRNKNSFNEKFGPVHKALSDLKINAVIDGEIVILNDDGRSDFGKLQNWSNVKEGQLAYFVFDLLWLNGYSLLDLPLSERREQLKQIIPEHPVIKLSDDFNTTGTAFFEVASQMGLEGIMAKKADAPYVPGSRTPDWLKIKISKRHEVVIGGYTRNRGSGKLFSSLLVGVYEGNKLRYSGKIGTGFSDRQQKKMLTTFKKIEVKQCPFDDIPDINKKTRFNFVDKGAVATWLKPELVCEVAYTEITADGVMRHPSFMGMREDKTAAEVIEEVAVSSAGKGDSIIPSNQPEQLIAGKSKKELRIINKKELTFTNLDKLYWPKEKIAKRSVINYYHSVAEYILPYLANRPQSLNRHPNGINGESFYQKNIAGKFPSWIRTHDYENTTKDGAKKFFVCTDEASLLYMANLGCIEINPWHSRISSPDRPDFCIIDLDPDNNSFSQVIDSAMVVYEVLKSLDVPSYPKTSGSTGIHIYIPLGAAYSYDQSRMLAELVVTLVHREIPGYTSLERSPSKRRGKIYLDFLQNRSIQTIAAPYSLRPKPGATVSMPLEWDEVKPGLSMNDFTIHTAYQRIISAPDIFRPVLGKGIMLENVLKKLEKLL